MHLNGPNAIVETRNVMIAEKGRPHLSKLSRTAIKQKTHAIAWALQ